MFVEYMLDIPLIVDTDFREKASVNTEGISIELADAVIRAYERRKLPVIPNLIKAFVWYDKALGNSINFAILKNKQLNPQYKKYADEIDKYLLLL